MMKKSIKAIITVAAIVVVAIAVYLTVSSPKSPTIEADKGHISNMETMAQLCAIEIYSEVPIVDTIDNKVICAIQKQRGSIAFDLENMQITTDGDTVKVIMPDEIVTITEATDNDSWKVVDTKAIGPLAMLRSDKLTLEDENRVKAKIERKAKVRLYKNGTVKRARAEGAQNIKKLLEKIYRKPVKVTDPTPEGSYGKR